MSRLPRISGRECVRALGRVGFRLIRQRGSHIILRREDPFAQLVALQREAGGTPRQLASMDYFGTRAGRYRQSHGNEEALAQLARMAGLRGDEFVLDVGTGPGHLACALAPHARHVVASDLAMLMLREIPLVMQEKGVSNSIRGHWRIENGLHYVRDVTMGEDGSQVRIDSVPQVMGALINVVISILRLFGATNIGSAIRNIGWQTNGALRMLGLCPWQ